MGWDGSQEAQVSPSGEVSTYRSSVGMPGGYDLMGGLQFALLIGLGLREQHRLCDVGCGSLRAGRLLIPYLQAGNYYGVEPSAWKVEEGLRHELGGDLAADRKPTFGYFDDFSLESFGCQFDYVLAQSVFSHTYRDLALSGLEHVRATLSPSGVLVATFYETMPVILPVGVSDRPTDGSGFRTSLCVAYTWREWSGIVRQAGLVCRRLRWRHKRQTWFLAGHVGSEARLDQLAKGITNQLRGPTMLGSAAQRVRRRIGRKGS